MRGGEIEVNGSAGTYLCEHLCEGAAFASLGARGDFAGASNQGCTIIIGSSTYLLDAEMSKGTITVNGDAKVLSSFQTMGIVQIDGLTLQKYAGDLVGNGKSELLVGSS